MSTASHMTTTAETATTVASSETAGESRGSDK
jgi:hypothetical protein